MYRKTVTIIITIIFAFSIIAPVQAVKDDKYVMKAVYRFNDKPNWAVKPSKESTSKVQIINIANGDTVMNGVTVIATAPGATELLLGDTTMTSSPDGERYFGTWSGTTGESTITVIAMKGEESIGSATVNVEVVDTKLWLLNLEIDCINDYYPSEIVTTYLTQYWAGFAIDLQINVDDRITLSGDTVISDSEFWTIEKEYNNGVDNSDSSDSDGDGTGYDYTLPQKWMLWGGQYTDSNVGGYTYVVINRKDAIAGNYIFIAEEMIDKWENDNGFTEEENGEVIVACHELGHSIGILKTRGVTEQYDPDYYSVMSLMRQENAGQMDGAWYYSSSYWQTKNLEYYSLQ